MVTKTVKKVVKKKVSKKKLASDTVVNNVVGEIVVDPVVVLRALATNVVDIDLGDMDTRFSGKLKKLAVEIGKVGTALAKALDVQAKVAAKKQAQIDKYAKRIDALKTN